MPCSISCPTCHVRFSVEESSLGQSVRCPNCGNVFTATSAEAVVAGKPSPASSVPAGNVQKTQASGDHWAWMVPGVLAIVAFGALTLIATGGLDGGMLLVIGSLIVGTPALIRTLLVSNRKLKHSGEARIPLDDLATFLSSLGMSVMIGLAGFITILVSVLVAAMLGFIPFNPSGTGRQGSASPLAGIVIFGLVLAVIIWPLWKFFAKKR